ncbi:hypothetical protein [Salipaludibacillus neizhouensis]|nr:hypothetical protein [Salipaludibacillus neizhouensis]
MNALCNGIYIFLGIGLAFYAAGLLKDCLEKQEILREREKFETGE